MTENSDCDTPQLLVDLLPHLPLVPQRPNLSRVPSPTGDGSLLTERIRCQTTRRFTSCSTIHCLPRRAQTQSNGLSRSPFIFVMPNGALTRHRAFLAVQGGLKVGEDFVGEVSFAVDILKVSSHPPQINSQIKVPISPQSQTSAASHCFYGP